MNAFSCRKRCVTTLDHKKFKACFDSNFFTSVCTRAEKEVHFKESRATLACLYRISGRFLHATIHIC